MKRSYLYLTIGLAGGVTGGFLGVGGGIIMIPLMTWSGLTQKRAQGTSLAAAVPLAIAGMLMYGAADQLNPAAAIPLAVGGVIGAYLSSGLVRRFSNRTLYRLFGAVLLLIAIRHAYATLVAPTIDGSVIDISPVITGLVGIGAGMMAGFFGLGGGVIFVPAGVQLLGLTEKAAHGASLAAIIPTALMGMIRYRTAGNVEGPACLPLIVGAVAGSIISALLATGTNDKYLGLAFAVLLAFVGLRRLFGRNPQPK